MAFILGFCIFLGVNAASGENIVGNLNEAVENVRLRKQQNLLDQTS